MTRPGARGPGGPGVALRRWLLPLFLIAAATAAPYARVADNLFVPYDDPEYITDNPQVLGGLGWDGVVWAFTNIHERNWHPLTWISHMIDVSLFGLDPAGHHRVSLALHVANALLLFGVLAVSTGKRWRSVCVALLFSLHPLRVESVAWAAERKDLLCSLFWLLTMGAYHRYVRRPGWRRYLLVLVPFAAGLMAKPMIVSLPAVLLLYDYWPLGRILCPGGVRLRTALLEKIPLLLLSAGSSAITYHAQTRRSGVLAFGSSIVGENLGNALQNLVAYLAKTAWPSALAVSYPPAARLDPGHLSLAVVALLVCSFAAVWWRRRHPALLVGWLWFLFVLAPVSGVVRIGYASLADRYAYLPHIGLFTLAVWGAAAVPEAWPRLRPALVALAGGVLLCLAVMSSRQVRHWHDGISLMGHALAVTSKNWFACNSLCADYLMIATQDRARNISASLPLAPADPRRLGTYLMYALDLCTTSVRWNPAFPVSRYNLGLIHFRLGNRDAAVAQYEELLHMKSDYSVRLRDAIQ